MCPHTLHPGAIQGKEGIKFCHLAILNRENTDKGKFAFTTDDYDVFEVCFISRVPANRRGQRHEVLLNLKHGVEAKSYEGLGDAAKLKPLEVELKRLEDLSESIVQGPIQ